ncbi:hypothetical protein [Vagococcus fessus]|uniref:Uncharacterized protein n=1 Tax=Vagococcus fessus TaxID=120370 RepID=A0A430A7X2_9ENTE|nr:hypothetical protein [Vagococcus fessus]RSU03164.1 hypothetical protein CBF31_05455 [Vagococcus fessus]
MEGTVFIGSLESSFKPYKTTCAYQPGCFIFFNVNRKIWISDIEQVVVTMRIIQFNYQGEKYCLASQGNGVFEPLKLHLEEALKKSIV